MSDLVHELLLDRAEARPDSPALGCQGEYLTYAELAAQVEVCARGLASLTLARSERIAVYLPKRFETVVALFAGSAVGGAFVPVNPLLKPLQVGHILRDCNVRVLVTDGDRASLLKEELTNCHDLRQLVLIDSGSESVDGFPHLEVLSWEALLQAGQAGDGLPHRVIDTDLAALLYTSGSTGRPKGVVLSHRNMVAGARSVSTYLENRPDDRLLAVLSLSFDYGLSQLTTAFTVGASAYLLEYLLPRDVIKAVAEQRLTGLAAVPPLWMQLANLPWPEQAAESLRYITNSGGAMPEAITAALKASLPKTSIYWMYGLTEAFRSTYLPPQEIELRPTSMGKAIPNAEILVVRDDGTPCAPGEPGELVHRGALVSLGYWNDPERTAVRFRPAPGQPDGIPTPEIAVWSGDTVRMDEEGFLYFIGRKDDMIKTSGYRVSPTEVEEVVYASGQVSEVAALGLPHPSLGHGIVLIAKTSSNESSVEDLLAICKRDLPTYMVPLQIITVDALPRNPNGKIDRGKLVSQYRDLFQGDAAE